MNILKNLPIIIFSGLLLGMLNVSCASVESPPIMDDQSVDRILKAKSAYFEKLNDRFKKQSRENDWAKGMEKEVRQSYKDDGLEEKVILRQVDCRQSLCAIDLEFDSHDAFLVGNPAVLEWLAKRQTCAFYIPGLPTSEDGGKNRTQRIHLQCQR